MARRADRPAITPNRAPAAVTDERGEAEPEPGMQEEPRAEAPEQAGAEEPEDGRRAEPPGREMP